MRILLRTAVALYITSCLGAVIDFDSPKQKLFVYNQKINLVYQLLDLECPHYVNKRDAVDTASHYEVGSMDDDALHAEIAKRTYDKLIGQLLKCRQETAPDVTKAPVETTTAKAEATSLTTTTSTTTPTTTTAPTTMTPESVAYKDCQDYYEQGFFISGVYEINPPNSTLPPFNVWCDFADGHGWTVIQKRTSATSFYKNWNDYKNGFGDVGGHHWLGNDKIHLLTQTNQKLNISLVASDGEERYAAYNLFQVADEADKYRLTVSAEGYTGTLEEWLTRSHNGRMFTTWDNDNDVNQGGNCAVDMKGGWWYRFCWSVDLNNSGRSGMCWGDCLWHFELSVMRIGRD